MDVRTTSLILLLQCALVTGTAWAGKRWGIPDIEALSAGDTAVLSDLPVDIDTDDVMAAGEHIDPDDVMAAGELAGEFAADAAIESGALENSVVDVEIMQKLAEIDALIPQLRAKLRRYDVPFQSPEEKRGRFAPGRRSFESGLTSEYEFGLPGLDYPSFPDDLPTLEGYGGDFDRAQFSGLSAMGGGGGSFYILGELDKVVLQLQALVNQ